MTRDGNAALNIFKMALSVILMRLKNKSHYPDLLYEDGDGEDDDGDEEDDDGDEEEDDEMDWELDRVVERGKVYLGEKRKREGDDDTCVRGPLLTSNVLPNKRRAVPDHCLGFISGSTQGYRSPAPVLN